MRVMSKKHATTVTTPQGSVRVPGWVVDHKSFLKWLRSGVIPEEVRVSYINGQVWVDPMSERAFSHNWIKTAIASVLLPLVDQGNLGVFFGDGMTFTSEDEEFT